MRNNLLKSVLRRLSALCILSAAISFSVLTCEGYAASDTFTPVSTEKTDFSSYFGSGCLTMLANHDSDAQSLSVIIETGDGGMIIVDGGWDYNGESLLAEIKARGGHVYAWVITHPHRDHAMALAYILNNHHTEITIDGIYYNFFDAEWYKQNDPESVEVIESLYSGFDNISEDKLHGDICSGQIIEAGAARIQVLNDPYKASTNSGNNSSVAFTVSLNGTNTVFLGDLALAGGKALMDKLELSPIKCNIVQVAHHGQAAVDYSFYQQLMPRVFLWPTPEWLWNNDGGSGPGTGQWNAVEDTKNWQKGLLIREYYVTKDGDQVLE